MKKHKKHHNEFKVDEFDMDELLAEAFYIKEEDEDDWMESYAAFYNNYVHYYDDNDDECVNYCYNSLNTEFCEFRKGDCCLIDYYGERIFRDILDEDNCKIGNYKTEEEYNKAKEVIALYNFYKQNPKQVEFMLKLID